MALPNIFDAQVCNEMIARIQKLTPASTPQWGKMNVAQMLAHCNVAYEMAYEPTKHAQPGAFKKWILKMLVKPTVVGEKMYKKNSHTAPQFIMTEEKNFETEKNRLIQYIEKTQAIGAKGFEQKEAHSFGKLSATEWNNMLYKHLEHHLTQFGV